MEWFHPQLLAGGEFDNFAEIHHCHCGTQVQDGCQVMRNEQIADAELLLEILQQIHNLGTDRDIERRHGLVEDNKARVQRQGPRDSDALPLAATEFVRKEIDRGRSKADEIQEFMDALPDLGLWECLIDDQGLSNDIAHSHAWSLVVIRILCTGL